MCANLYTMNYYHCTKFDRPKVVRDHTNENAINLRLISKLSSLIFYFVRIYKGASSFVSVLYRVVHNWSDILINNSVANNIQYCFFFLLPSPETFTLFNIRYLSTLHRELWITIEIRFTSAT